MANKISRLLSLFRKRGLKPSKPVRRSKETTGGGHRGVAIGNTQSPDLSAENVGKWQSLPAEAVENFVYNQEPLFVHSTNVRMMQYFIEERYLLVEFRDGDTYKYNDVTEDEAIKAAKQESKGGFVWDVLRIRGTKFGHKKPYTKVSGGYKPPQKGSEEVTIDGETYEVVKEQGGATRYRLKQ